MRYVIDRCGRVCGDAGLGNWRPLGIAVSSNVITNLLANEGTEVPLPAAVPACDALKASFPAAFAAIGRAVRSKGNAMVARTIDHRIAAGFGAWGGYADYDGYVDYGGGFDAAGITAMERMYQKVSASLFPGTRLVNCAVPLVNTGEAVVTRGQGG